MQHDLAGVCLDIRVHIGRAGTTPAGNVKSACRRIVVGARHYSNSARLKRVTDGADGLSVSSRVIAEAGRQVGGVPVVEDDTRLTIITPIMPRRVVQVERDPVLVLVVCALLEAKLVYDEISGGQHSTEPELGMIGTRPGIHASAAIAVAQVEASPRGAPVARRYGRGAETLADVIVISGRLHLGRLIAIRVDVGDEFG